MAEKHQANPKPQRPWKPKTRTGCVTCRVRRIKCDEGKPECRRCLNYGQRCGGYKAPVTIQSGTSSRLLLPKSGGFAISHPSSLLPGETGVENRYFRHFQDTTAPDLAGPFDEALWNILILQAHRQEPFVRHAVVAIGALDKSLQLVPAISKCSNLENPPGRDMSRLHREFALLEYNKALKAMKGVSWETETNPRKALIACLLVVCIENLLSNRHGALCHAEVGHRLLQKWLDSKPHTLPHKAGISSPASHAVEDDLVLVFGKLDMQISSVSDTRPIQEHIVLKMDSCVTVQQIPATFGNLKEAKVFLDIVIRRAYHFMSAAFITSNSQALSKPFELTPPNNISVVTGTNMHSSTNIISDELRAEQVTYAQELSRWSQAFQPLFCKLQKTAEGKLRRALILLQIHYLATKIMVAAIVFDEEISYDQFEPDFREMLDLMKSGMRTDKKGYKTWDRGMSFEPGLTSPLCLIAMRCRHRQLRREAISILHFLPDENAWEPELIAALGNWIMEVEEEGVTSEIIPESSRAIFSRISEIPKSKTALFQCIQRSGGPDGGPIWKEKLVHF